MNRKGFLKGALAGIATVAAGSKLSAETQKPKTPDLNEDFNKLINAPTPIIDPAQMRPDFTVKLGDKTVYVDIDLLGPNGEMTVGFVASLDTHHGDAWKNLKDLKSQDHARIKQFMDHMEHHDIKAEDVESIYQAAKREWLKKYAPDNAPAPSQ